jgi:hypothetical protein
MLFELVGARWLLLVFPNTFEYFFIAVEVLRLRHDPVRLSRRFLVLLAAAIWIVVKLPQEWWIHVAQLDATDTIKKVVFGVPADASWGTAITNRPFVTVGIVVLAVTLVLVVARLLRPRLAAAAPADRRGFAADPVPAEVADTAGRAAWRARTGRLLSAELVEQIVLVTLICGIFAQMLPGPGVGAVPKLVAIVVLVTVDGAVGLWAARSGRSAGSVGAGFAVLLVLNAALVYAGAALFGIALDRGAATVFLLLLVLLVALYAAYRPVLTYRRDRGLLDTVPATAGAGS